MISNPRMIVDDYRMRHQKIVYCNQWSHDETRAYWQWRNGWYSIYLAHMVALTEVYRPGNVPARAFSTLPGR
jgi:hypothetical protein